MSSICPFDLGLSHLCACASVVHFSCGGRPASRVLVSGGFSLSGPESIPIGAGCPSFFQLSDAPGPVAGIGRRLRGFLRLLDPQTFDPQTVALPVSRPDVNPLLLEVEPLWLDCRVRSASGLQAWQTYRHPAADTYEDNTTAFFLALVLLDVGISHRWTEQALRFPDLVTLGLSPYAANIEDIVLVARNRGHEIVLALPLPAGEDVFLDPGPLVVPQTARGEALQDGLARLLSRVAGYMCVYNATPSPARFDSAFMEVSCGAIGPPRPLFSGCSDDLESASVPGGGSAVPASRRRRPPNPKPRFYRLIGICPRPRTCRRS